MFMWLGASTLAKHIFVTLNRNKQELLQMFCILIPACWVHSDVVPLSNSRLGILSHYCESFACWLFIILISHLDFFFVLLAFMLLLTSCYSITAFAEDKYTAIFQENSYVVRVLQAVALPLIGNVCHAFMHSFNRTEVFTKLYMFLMLAHYNYIWNVLASRECDPVELSECRFIVLISF